MVGEEASHAAPQTTHEIHSGAGEQLLKAGMVVQYRYRGVVSLPLPLHRVRIRAKRRQEPQLNSPVQLFQIAPDRLGPVDGRVVQHHVDASFLGMASQQGGQEL